MASPAQGSERSTRAIEIDARPENAAGTFSNVEKVEQPGPAGLLDSVLAATPSESAAGKVDAFLDEPSLEKSLLIYIDQFGPARRPRDKAALARLLNRDVARIDAVLNRQVNCIIHHPRFQKLEASWCGLRYLVNQVDEESNAKVRVLNVGWQALARDFDKAIEFDQSQLFRKIYNEEFGISGGEPVSVLLGDYEVRPRPEADHPIDDIATLQSLSQVAAAAFCPFITSAHPAMFGLNQFGELQRPMNLERIFQQPEYLKWRRLRESDDSRFLGLAMPRVLMRVPYENSTPRADGFSFREDVAAPDASRYLWGNAVYAYGAVLLRAFAQSHWLADVRGVRRDLEEGGLVTGLPVHSFSTERKGITPKYSTDVSISDAQEHELSDLGFLPLCPCKDSEFSAFYSSSSIQRPQTYDRRDATANAKVSAMLQYMLCASRVAHYLKVIGREKVGSFYEAEQCQDFINSWLQQYVTQDDDAEADVKAMFPLREAQVQVREQPGKPGCYFCVIQLQPHYQLDEMATSIQLTTELAPAE